MRRKTRQPEKPLIRIYELTLPDGRVLSRGAVCRLVGRIGWFRFLYLGNGALTFWGPTNEQGTPKGTAQFTSVHTSEVGKYSNRIRRNE